MIELFKELGEALNPVKIAKDLKSIEYDYDHDEDGNMLSCCGEILDPDVMRCEKCGEHN